MFLNLQRAKKISSLTTDKVQVISGRVVAPEEVTVPGTNIRCACYWMLTEAWKTGARGRGRKMWVPAGTKTGNNGFFVENGTEKIWVCNTIDGLDIRNGWNDSGLIGKKGNQRFISRAIKNGDTIKIRGTISHPKGAEPAETLVVRPDAKGFISIIQKKKTKS